MKLNLANIKQDYNMFITRKQRTKITFLDSCREIIKERLTFEQALTKLTMFLEVVEMAKHQHKISIDNKYGRFLAVWNNDGNELIYYEFKSNRDVF